MKRNNVKLLTDEEIERLNDLYDFEIDNGKMKVICRHYNRIRSHPIDESFSITSKVRRLTFTVEAMNIYKSIGKIYNYSLIDIQNAVNELHVLYQDINDVTVNQRLKDKRKQKEGLK